MKLPILGQPSWRPRVRRLGLWSFSKRHCLVDLFNLKRRGFGVLGVLLVNGLNQGFNLHESSFVFCKEGGADTEVQGLLALLIIRPFSVARAFPSQSQLQIVRFPSICFQTVFNDSLHVRARGPDQFPSYFKIWLIFDLNFIPARVLCVGWNQTVRQILWIIF